MAPALKTAQLVRSVARLTGDQGRRVSEGLRFRVVVTSSDGHRCGVSTQVDDHAKEVRPHQLGQIAERWCLTRVELVEALDSWNPERLIEHLSSKTKAELMPPRGRH